MNVVALYFIRLIKSIMVVLGTKYSLRIIFKLKSDFEPLVDIRIVGWISMSLKIKNIDISRRSAWPSWVRS